MQNVVPNKCPVEETLMYSCFCLMWNDSTHPAGPFLCVYSCFSLFFIQTGFCMHPAGLFSTSRSLPEFMTRSSSHLIRVLVRLSLYMFSVPRLCLSKPSYGSYCRPDLFAWFTHTSSATFLFFSLMVSHPRTNQAKPCLTSRGQMRLGVPVVVWP